MSSQKKTFQHNPVNVQDQLVRIGEFGFAQYLQVLVAGGAWSLVAFFNVLNILANLGNTLIQCKTDNPDCEQVVSTNTICSIGKDQWQWNSKGYSLVTEFDLICGRGWLVYLTGIIYSLGMLAGSIVFYSLSERYSRRRLLYSSCLITGIAGGMAATAPQLWMHLVFRFIIGAGNGGMILASWILATDVAGYTWRPTASLCLLACYSMGGLTASLVVSLIPSWRWMMTLTSLLTLAYITTWSLMIESPHWLLIRGQKGMATASIAALAFANKTRPPSEPLSDPVALLSNPHRTASAVLKNTHLRLITILASSIWCVASVCYLGVAMLSSSLGGSAVELLVTGFAYEVPGIAAAALAADRIGRKTVSIAGFLQAAVCCIAAAFLADDAQRTLAVASRFGLAVGISASMFVSTLELYPVVVQHQGVGITNIGGRIGAILAPLIALLAYMIHTSVLSLLLCGALALLAAVLCVGLPETLGCPIYETIQDMSNANVKRHRSWTAALQIFRPALPASPGVAKSIVMTTPTTGTAAERNV